MQFVKIFFSIFFPLFFVYVFIRYFFEFRITRVYSEVLDLERNEADSSHNLFQTLLNFIRRLFLASGIILYTVENEMIQPLEFSFSKRAQGISMIIRKGKNSFGITALEWVKKGIWKACLDLAVFREQPSKHLNVQRNKIVIPILKSGELKYFLLLIYTKRRKNFFARINYRLNRRKIKKVSMEMITYITAHSQNQFSVMIENIRDYAFIRLNKELQILTWNKGAEIVFGYPVGEMLSKNIVDLIPKENMDEIKNSLHKVGREGESHLKIHIKDFQGNAVSCEIFIKGNFVSGVLTGYFVLIKDVSKDEVILNDMKQRAMLNRNIVENSRDGIVVLNKSDRIIFFNDRFKNITELNFSLLGMDIANTFQWRHGSEIKEKLWELRDKGIEFNSCEMKIGMLWYHIRIFPILEKGDENPVYKGAVVYFIDNTRVMKHREQMENKNDQLRQMNQFLMEDLKSARILHNSLLPPKTISSDYFAYDVLYYQCDQLGGDFYFAEEIQIGGETFEFVLAVDVSGHGVGASMLAVFVKEIYNDFKIMALTRAKAQPSTFMNLLNEKLCALELSSIRFLTAFFMVYDCSKRKLSFSSAGHPHMSLISEGKIDFLGLRKSPPIGMFNDYQFEQDAVTVKKPSRFLLYTDGLLDAFSGQESYTGYLNDFLFTHREKNREELKSELEESILESLKKCGDDVDDITVIIGEIK